jgi:hypothetical protein
MAPVMGLAPIKTGLKDRALGSLHSRAEKRYSRPDSHGDRALIQCDSVYKTDCAALHHGSKTDLKEWRNAEGMLPITRDGATISLAKSPGSLVRFTFHDWCPWQDLHLH